jgi:hypothetical protein
VGRALSRARGATPSDVEAFGLIAAAPVKVGCTRQARRSRPQQLDARSLLVRHPDVSGETDGGRLLWERLLQKLDRIGGMIRQARRVVTLCFGNIQSAAESVTMRLDGLLADVAEWQTLQT